MSESSDTRPLATRTAIVSLDTALSERDRLSLYWVAAIALPLFPMAMVALPFIGPWTALKAALLATMPIGVAVSLWIWKRTREPGRQDLYVRNIAFLGLGVPVALNAIHFGIFSPAILILFLFIYAASLNGDVLGIVALVLVGLLHAVGAALFITGSVSDPGLVQLRVSGPEALLGEILTQSCLVAGLLLGRTTRHTSTAVLRDLHEANLDAARKAVVAREMAARLRRAQGPDRRGPLSGLEIGGYVLGSLLGRGGMGEVYRGESSDGEVVAVKLLSPSITQSDTTLERFRRESEALSKLHHRNIVSLLDAGTTDDGLPYMAMELLEGRDLSEVLRAAGTLDFQLCLMLVEQVGSALDYAWEQGLVHRDLKPENLFYVDDDAAWKILDFGIAKATGAEPLTQGYVLGTPAYMSPEHARGQSVDRRSDLFALSAIAYRALTGFPAFSGGNAPALVHAVVYEFPQLPSTLAELDEDVDRALAIGLAKTPEDRFQSGEDLTFALRAAADGELPAQLRERGDRLLAMWQTDKQVLPTEPP